MTGDPRLFAVETLSYPFQILDDVINDSNVSVCLDIGHLIMTGQSLQRHYDRYLDKTRVVHIHGIIDGHDHACLSGLDNEVIDTLLSRLTETSAEDRVVTIEVFSESDLDCSLLRLERYRHD